MRVKRKQSKEKGRRDREREKEGRGKNESDGRKSEMGEIRNDTVETVIKLKLPLPGCRC